jgi:N6-adenosine-specific RNA methylase IME4
MKLQEIKDLPIKDIADETCVLLLWATFPQLQEALEVIKA